MSKNIENIPEEEIDELSHSGFPPETAQLLSWSSLRFIRSPSSDFLMWSIVAVSVTCIVVLMLSALIEMDVSVRAPGSIVSDFGSREAITPASGQVTTIYKNVGDLVHENDVIALLKISPESEKELNDAISTFENLEKKIRFYQTSKVFDFIIQNLPSLTNLESGSALDAIIGVEQQAKSFADQRSRLKNGLAAELRPLKQRAAILESKIRKMKNSKERQLLGLFLENTQDELGKINSQISGSENEAKLKLEQALGELLRSVQSAEGALKNHLDQRVVRSPIDGSVSDLFTKVNFSIEAGKAVARIIPKDSQLMAGVYVFSKDIVKIAEGKSVLFKVEAYPYQTYGSFTGKVISFEQTKEDNAAFGEYVVYCSIDFPKTVSEELRSKMRLIVGMKLNADIVVERKSGLSIIKKMVFERQ